MEDFFIDSRDGKQYRTVKIGSQTWLAENLNFAAEGSYYYKNDESYAETYGRLYTWDAAIKACPAGWHLPSDGEWQTLVDFAGGAKIAGTKLKSKTGWCSDDKRRYKPATDEHGFSALPGGSGFVGGNFTGIGHYGDWWSATETATGRAWHRYMNYASENVERGGGVKAIMLSVRCVRDE